MPTIQGTVKLEGKPAGSTYVRLLGPSGEFVSERYTGDDGRFTFHVETGKWTIEAKAAGARTETRVVDISAADATAEIELKKA